MNWSQYFGKTIWFNEKHYIAEIILNKNHVLTHTTTRFTTFGPILLPAGMKNDPTLLPVSMKRYPIRWRGGGYIYLYIITVQHTHTRTPWHGGMGGTTLNCMNVLNYLNNENIYVTHWFPFITNMCNVEVT